MRPGDQKCTLKIRSSDLLPAVFLISIMMIIVPSWNATASRANSPPVIVISSPVNGSAHSVGEDIFFDASGSYDPDGDSISFSWDFDDRDGIGVNAQGDRVHHAYSEKGQYNITLLATDGSHISKEKWVVRITNYPPVAVINASATEVYPDEVVSFNASGSSDDDGVIVNYTWDFGDGSSGYGVSVSHSFSSGGPYTVTLTVTDDFGATGSAEVTITISNIRPVAAFDAVPMTAKQGETIFFDASASYDPDGTISSYFFDFGYPDNYTGPDETTLESSTPYVNHRYTLPGDYTPRLRVVDDRGESSFWYELPTPIKVEYWENTPPVAEIIAPENGSTVYGKAVVEVSVSDSDGDTIASVSVRLSGGEWVPAWDDNGDGIWEATIDTASASDGTHKLEARAYDGYDYGYASVVVDVNNTPPSGIDVNAWPSKNPVEPGETFYINGTVKYDRGDMVKSGTCDIVLGDFVYSAPINDGSFSRSLTLEGYNTTVISITATDDVFNVSGSTSVEVRISTADIRVGPMDLWAEHTDGKIVSTANNPAIDGETIRLRARIHNEGMARATCTVVFSEGGLVIRSQDITVEANDTAMAEATYIARGGAHNIDVNITSVSPPDPNTEDNHATLSISVRYYSNLIVQSIKPSISEVKKGEPVTISVTVSNVGDITASCTVTLYYIVENNSREVDSSSVESLYPGGKRTLLFTHRPDRDGQYRAVIGNVKPYETDTGDNDGSVSIAVIDEKKGSGETAAVPSFTVTLAALSLMGALLWRRKKL